jgi:pyrroloquinoline-quinone synthase
MRTHTVADQLELALDGRRLLTHPFYRRWEAGGLEPAELARYAEQYVHIERCVPETLRAAAEGLEAGPARAQVEANLAQELGPDQTHVELFASFAGAVEAGDAAPSPATRQLVELCRSAAACGPAEALSVLGVYEVQAAEIARTKADGLRRHYGLDAAGTAFWDVHAAIEDAHAAGTMEALAGADPAVVLASARAAADLWWRFLDEREALAGACS